MSDSGTPEPLGALERFRRSMAIDFEKWHDGIGYDLDALRVAMPPERAQIERLLLQRGARDWRDVEALALLDTPAARTALLDAMKHDDPQVRLAVTRHAPSLVADEKRTASLVRALRTARPFEGLSAVLDEAEAFHPPEVIEALLRATVEGDGEAAVHCAALLLHLHGKADSAFDMALRPFFLRFNTDDRAAREAAFRELCARIGADAEALLRSF